MFKPKVNFISTTLCCIGLSVVMFMSNQIKSNQIKSIHSQTYIASNMGNI